MTTSGRRLFTAELRKKAAAGVAADSAMTSAAGGVSLQDIYALMQSLSQEMGEMRQDIVNLGQGVQQSPTVVDTASVAQDEAQNEGTLSEVATLKTELRALAYCIEQTKAEIASLRSGDDDADADHFVTVATELDEVVSATESATDRILDSCEMVETLATTLRANTEDVYARQVIEDIIEQTTKIFEACNFQDITGQRITKVVRTLQYIDQRIGSMLDIWGAESLSHLPGTDFQAFTQEDTIDLHGPQAGEAGISQEEIDKLFD